MCLEGASSETIGRYYDRFWFAQTIPIEIQRLIHTLATDPDKKQGLLQTHIALLAS